MFSLDEMIPLSEARQRIRESVTPLPVECVPLTDVLGRVLRENIVAAEDVPAFDRSAMDGYAVIQGDRATAFRLVGEVQPGEGCASEVREGECMRIFTGARLPPGASAVLMQEDVERQGEWVIPVRSARARNVRLRGEDARAGDLLLREGVRIGAVQASLMAQMGLTHLSVGRRPRVLHLVTGSELVDPGQVPAPGQIRDSNSTLVAGLVADAGGVLVWQRRVADRLEEFLEAVRGIPEEAWDLLLISGGASVGDYDFGARALECLGFETRFHGVRLRPGKPLAFAQREGQCAFLLPGNPVSHWVVFEVAVRLAMERMQGALEEWVLVSLPLASDLKGASDRRETFWPGILRVVEGALAVEPVAWQSSGDLCAIGRANLMLQVPPESGPKMRGTPVNCLLLKGGAVPLD
jgi:molybdopterin molybdotransferase